MNMQCRLIWELNEFELAHNFIEASKNLCCAKGEGARGVMVSIVGNGHDDVSSNPGRD